MLMPMEKYKSKFSSSIYEKIVGKTRLFNLKEATRLGDEKLWIQNQHYSAEKLTLCHILAGMG